MELRKAAGLLLLVSACSSAPQTIPHLSPEELALHSIQNSEEIETIALLGMNDFHGALAAVQKDAELTPEGEKVTFTTGGAAIFSSHVKALREEFGSRLLLIDAGDEWQGTIDSNLEEGKPVVRFFNSIGLQAAALGNHEFDFGPIGEHSVVKNSSEDPLETLKTRLTEAAYPYLSANIYDKQTRQHVQWPNLHSRVVLTAGNLKVGVVGLTTLQTPSTTRAQNVSKLEFKDLVQTTLEESKKLRQAGAQIVVATAHVGLKCSGPNPSPLETQTRVYTPSTPQEECGKKDELVQFLKQLPKGTLDAVVAGHSHQLVHHWVNGVPVIMGGASGLYYNLAFIHYSRRLKRVVPELTRIHGPIPVCEKVFENQGNCDPKQSIPPKGRGNLITPVLYGHDIEPDSSIEDLLKETFKKTEAKKKKVVGTAAREVPHDRTRESEMGNLISDAIRAQARTEVSLTNPGGIRAPFDAGPITYQELYQTMPFDNMISVLSVTGHELRNILRVANNGAKGYFSTSGLIVTAIDLPFAAPWSDLDADGKQSVWETNRILDVRLENGKPLQNQKLYSFATADFLVSGGDDLGWPMSQVAKERIRLDAAGLVRDAIQNYLEKHSPVHTVENPLVKADRPRLILKKLK